MLVQGRQTSAGRSSLPLSPNVIQKQTPHYFFLRRIVFLRDAPLRFFFVAYF